MNKRLVVALLAILAASAPARGASSLLYDFESGTEGWVIDWGLKQDPTNTTGRTKHGKNSLVLTHVFKGKDETLGVHVPFLPPRDFGQLQGFGGISAWVFFPTGDGWQAQLYVHSGDEWKWSVGPLYQNLQPGWHQILIRSDEIGNPGMVRDLGVQIKNYKLGSEATIFIDRVEAICAVAP